MKIVVFFIQVSMKFVSKGATDNNPALVQIMACRLLGTKPSCEIYVSRPHELSNQPITWINGDKKTSVVSFGVTRPKSRCF